jgi:hypothetical protein
MERQVGENLVSIKRTTHHFDLFKEEYVKHIRIANFYEVKVTNEQGKEFVHTFEYSSKGIKEVDEDFFAMVLEQIEEAFYVRSDLYNSFEDFCFKNGYDVCSEQNRKDYQDALELGDKLKKVISDEWIEGVRLWKQLSQ